jgi:hypothetical protein
MDTIPQSSFFLHVRNNSITISFIIFLFTIFSIPCFSQARGTYPSFTKFAEEFWSWRAINQPLSGDDVTRIERPENWTTDWSPETVLLRQKKTEAFQNRWESTDTTGWSISQQVDYRAIGSAIARVNWELNVLPAWRINPLFYIHQTLGSLFDILIIPPPFDIQREKLLLLQLDRIPQTVKEAKINLDQPVRPYAKLAIGILGSVRTQLETMTRELEPHLSAPVYNRMLQLTENAIVALESFSQFLEDNLQSMRTETAVGRENYLYFLRNIALMPYSPEELVQMAGQEWERSVAFETLEQQRNARLPELPIFKSAQEQIEKEAKQEMEIRQYLEEKKLLTVPDWMKHYLNLLILPYLAPLAHMGVTDDLTSATRLNENAYSYIRQPSPTLSYFRLSTAKDPRPIIVHEGIPGHYFQMALSWAHENPIRRYYYDSGANEGVGFYAEEMMLQAGLFDDSPRTREIIYNYMRLRALRVEVDVKLAIGEFSIPDAGKYLRKTVPMDSATAYHEAAFFASTPGQAISYQIGKLQIVKFLSDAKLQMGKNFNLQEFHDFVWKNGNVPIALQRWEYLGLRDEIKQLDAK